MSRWIVGVMVLVGALFSAEAKHVPVTQELVESGMVVIDIRTEPEWIETGIVKDAVPITFFDERGGYDVAAFLEAIGEHVSPDEPFALICRTGNRTTTVSNFLAQLGYEVINLQGGIRRLIDEKGYETTPYRP